MNDILRQNQLDEPTPLVMTTKMIEPARTPVSLPDEADSGPGVWISRAYSNVQMNSRIALPLRPGTWTVDWKTDLDAEYPASQLMTMKERILVSAGVWRLYDSSGKLIVRGSLGSGEIGADPANAMFYCTENSGYIAANDSRQGKLVFKISPAYGATYYRSLTVREGKKMIVISAEMPSDPHGSHVADKKIIEVDDLGQKLETDDTGFLESAREEGKLIVHAQDFVAAISDQKLVFALPGRICWTGFDLNPTQAFEEKFVPISLSLDNAGRAFLVVRQEQKQNLWVIAPNGIRLLSYEFEKGWTPTLHPPIIGFDHRVALICEEGMLILSKTGELTAKVTLKGGFVGAVVTSDRKLLVSTKSALCLIAPDGSETELFTFPGEELTTPPVLLEDGRLLVAGRNLYCLKSQK